MERKRAGGESELVSGENTCSSALNHVLSFIFTRSRGPCRKTSANRRISKRSIGEKNFSLPSLGSLRYSPPYHSLSLPPRSFRTLSNRGIEIRPPEHVSSPSKPHEFPNGSSLRARCSSRHSLLSCSRWHSLLPSFEPERTTAINFPRRRSNPSAQWIHPSRALLSMWRRWTPAA